MAPDLLGGNPEWVDEVSVKVGSSLACYKIDGQGLILSSIIAGNMSSDLDDCGEHGYLWWKQVMSARRGQVEPVGLGNRPASQDSQESLDTLV